MDKPLKEIITEQLDIKGFTLERIAEVTDIPLRYLEALLQDHDKKLPAAPYVRGYLLKIGKILGLDGSELWELYKKESGVKSSGPSDLLPSNRFAIKAINRKYVIAAIVIVIVIGYFIWQAPRFLGKPPLTINYPFDETTATSYPEIIIVGKSDPRDKLTIGSEEILVDKDGNFSKNYQLQQGQNTIEIKVKRFLGRETKVVKYVTYLPQQLEISNQ